MTEHVFQKHEYNNIFSKPAFEKEKKVKPKDKIDPSCKYTAQPSCSDALSLGSNSNNKSTR